MAEMEAGLFSVLIEALHRFFNPEKTRHGGLKTMAEGEDGLTEEGEYKREWLQHKSDDLQKKIDEGTDKPGDGILLKRIDTLLALEEYSKEKWETPDTIEAAKPDTTERYY